LVLGVGSACAGVTHGQNIKAGTEVPRSPERPQTTDQWDVIDGGDRRGQEGPAPSSEKWNLPLPIG